MDEFGLLCSMYIMKAAGHSNYTTKFNNDFVWSRKNYYIRTNICAHNYKAKYSSLSDNLGDLLINSSNGLVLETNFCPRIN